MSEKTRKKAMAAADVLAAAGQYDSIIETCRAYVAGWLIRGGDQSAGKGRISAATARRLIAEQMGTSVGASQINKIPDPDAIVKDETIVRCAEGLAMAEEAGTLSRDKEYRPGRPWKQ